MTSVFSTPFRGAVFINEVDGNSVINDSSDIVV